MTCRCGHGRQWHRPTANAISKKRRRGDRRPAQAGCRYLATMTGRKACPCRDWHPMEVAR